MKKKLFLVFILCLFCITTMLLIRFYNYNVKLDYFNNLVNLISSFANKIDVPKSGTIDVSASYKGAHGESNPKSLKFDYSINKGKITLEDEKIYKGDFIDLSVLNKLKMIDSSMISVKKRKFSLHKTHLELDEKKINERLFTNFKNVTLDIDKDILLNIDDIKVYIKEKLIEVYFGDNHIRLSFDQSTYSLFINNNFKMNAFVKENKYNIVLNNISYVLEYKDDDVYFGFKSQVDIYNEINMIITRKDNIKHNKSKEKYKDTEIPMVRYLKKCNLEVFK